MVNNHLKYLNKTNDYPVDFLVCTNYETKLQLMKYGFWMEALFDGEITPTSPMQFKFCKYSKRMVEILEKPQTLKSLEILKEKVLKMNSSNNLWKEFFFQKVSGKIRLKVIVEKSKKIKRKKGEATVTYHLKSLGEKHPRKSQELKKEKTKNKPFIKPKKNIKPSYKPPTISVELHKKGNISFYNRKNSKTNQQIRDKERLKHIQQINKVISVNEELYPKHYNKNFKNFSGIDKNCIYCGTKLTTTRVKNAIDYCVNCSYEDRDFVSNTPFYSREDYKKMKKMMFKNMRDNHKS